MKYSIIIPVLNEEKLLPRLLKQLTADSLKEKFKLEIIVSDGGSTDGSVEIAKQFADIVKVHNKKSRQGISLGKNIGAKDAKGEILVFINGDVLLSDPVKFFSHIEENFTKKPEYLAMTCFIRIFPEEEIFSDKFFHFLFNRYFRLINSIGIGMGRGECHIIRKKIFDEVGGYNESLAAGEDFNLFKRIRKIGNILFSKDICVYESPRRFRKLGYNKVTWLWLKNGLSVFVKNKAFSKVWEQVR